MIIDQAEMDALAAGNAPLPGAACATVAPARPAGATRPRPGDAVLERILKLRVPVIVQIASRRMPLAAIRRLSLGMIIEFEKNTDETLELRVRNRPIGRGEAVKVGENFGLRVTAIHDAEDRIRSLGS
jgi:flagellar motor switch protein FliN/FliY